MNQFKTKYNIEDSQYLGSGQYGKVFKVTTAQGQELAIKEFKSTANSHVKQIIREVDNLKILTHPNIARFYDCYIVDEKKYFIVMEYCQGGDLE